MAAKSLTCVLLLLVLMAIAAVVHPAAPFLLLLPALALALLWSGRFGQS